MFFIVKKGIVQSSIVKGSLGFFLGGFFQGKNTVVIMLNISLCMKGTCLHKS